MNYAVAAASLIFFALGFRFVRIVPIATEAIGLARGAVLVLGDRAKTEEEKERAARQAAAVLFGRFLLLAALTIVALLPAAALIGLAVLTGLANETQVMAALTSPWLIAAAFLLFIVDYRLRR